MPKRSDIKSILVIGAGPIVIGQGCEFDYSGTQACKVLKEDGYRIILVNSNPATIMTDPSTADSIYIEPVIPEIVEKIIEKERPDAILPTVGGQTGLNCSLALHNSGVLKKYNVKMLGASADAIDKAENRKRFNEAMANIGLDVPRNVIVQSLDAALASLDTIGLPAIIRPSFTLGGSGGGIATTKEEFINIVTYGLDMSPTNEVLIDESLLGWKEYEMEVIRDCKDNAIIVCSIENLDPLGVHTGDSITVAPALTLTDKEYQLMRNASIAVLREIGVETGGSNVQFAVEPDTGRLVIIEMNPRVSRSSALASKATGYPIAKVAAKLAVGYTLDEIDNDITESTPASFEPTIDYVVTKIPRFTFEKFGATNSTLSSQMKSVGEAMSIGRNFSESLQKGLRSIETGLKGLDVPKIAGLSDQLSKKEQQHIVRASLAELSVDRLLRVAHALRLDISISDIYDVTKIDRWFLDQIKGIVDQEKHILKHGLPSDSEGLLRLKKCGFSDAKLAELSGQSEDDITKRRHKEGIRPVYKKVDTCAGEFASKTPYLYSCYEGNMLEKSECEAQPTDRKKVIILGAGPNRIGQGIEFDYACVHAVKSVAEEGFESIMINCNPETVSTDYDTSDKLYFEPLTSEDTLEIIHKEQSNGTLLGVVVQFGGQTPLKLAQFLTKWNIPIIGTSPDKIDLAEDRERFKDLLDSLNLQQPKNDICHRVADIASTIAKVGYPVVVRPSNVLGGRAMAILHHENELKVYLDENESFLLDGPILIDKFLEDAIEIDVDAISDSKDVFIAGIMEHIERAGIHSGDSACSLPPFSINELQIKKIRESTVKLAQALDVVGLMNVQYAFQGNNLYIIEVNPRASRTVPFVAKATGVPVANIAAKVMIGEKLSRFKFPDKDPGYFSVKEAVFPFSRFHDVDTLLGPEMKSTGEVMGIDTSFHLAFAKSQLAAGHHLPKKGTVFFSVKDSDKPAMLKLAQLLEMCEFTIYATQGTCAYFKQNNVNAQVVNKVKEGGNHCVDLIDGKKINLVINTISGRDDISDSFSIRRSALMARVPYATTLEGAVAMVHAIKEMNLKEFSVHSIQELIRS